MDKCRALRSVAARLIDIACAAALIVACPVVAQTFPSKPIRLVVPFAPGRTGSRRVGWCWGGDGALPSGWWRKITATFIRIACAAALIVACPVVAQTFPSKPIRLVVPFAPGGMSDILARTVAEKMYWILRQPVVVDNRGGASGNIGTAMVAKATGDGYTLLFCSPAFATNVSLYSAPGYDPLKDFSPVAQIATATNLLVANPAINVHTVKEVIALARERRTPLNYGSGGIGTSGQLAAVLFQSAAGIKLTHVPYKGAGPSLTALLANEVQLMFSPILLVGPHVATGKLVPLAVTSARRSRAFPDVPTIAEGGMPGFDVSSWFGVVAPAGTPRSRIERLHRAITEVLNMPDVVQRLTSQGAEPVITTSDDFGRYVAAEVSKWSHVIKSAGIATN